MCHANQAEIGYGSHSGECLSFWDNLVPVFASQKRSRQRCAMLPHSIKMCCINLEKAKTSYCIHVLSSLICAPTFIEVQLYFAEKFLFNIRKFLRQDNL